MTIADLKDALAKISDVKESVRALISGLKHLFDEALASGGPAAAKAATDSIYHNEAALTEAVMEGPPADGAKPPEPAPPPAP